MCRGKESACRSEASAPNNQPFTNHRLMPRYIISLGSNLPSGKEEVTAAIDWLSEIATLLCATPTYYTPDIHDPSKASYTNAIAMIVSDVPTDLLAKMMKDYEISRGRISHNGPVAIDLDLVCRDNEILRPRDYCAPYFTEGLYLLSHNPGGKSSE